MFRKSSTFFLVLILSLALTVPTLAAPLAVATTIPGGNVFGTWDVIGNEREEHCPPGLLKKPEHPGPKNKE